MTTLRQRSFGGGNMLGPLWEVIPVLQSFAGGTKYTSAFPCGEILISFLWHHMRPLRDVMMLMWE